MTIYQDSLASPQPGISYINVLDGIVLRQQGASHSMMMMMMMVTGGLWPKLVDSVWELAAVNLENWHTNFVMMIAL